MSTVPSREEALAACRRLQAAIDEDAAYGVWSPEVVEVLAVADELAATLRRTPQSRATTALLRYLAAEPELIVDDPEPGERLPVSLDVARALLLKAADWLDTNRDLEMR